MFTYETVVRLHHTDAAGTIYYARVFDLAHAAFEAFLDDIGHPLPSALAAHPVVLPIAHATADYRAPLRLNDPLRIELWVETLSRRSFELRYRFLRADGELAAGVRTIHVAVDSESGESTELPDKLAEAFGRRMAPGD